MTVQDCIVNVFDTTISELTSHEYSIVRLTGDRILVSTLTDDPDNPSFILELSIRDVTDGINSFERGRAPD